MSPQTEFETLVNKRIKLFRKRLWTLTEWGFELHCEKDLEAHVQTWELRSVEHKAWSHQALGHQVLGHLTGSLWTQGSRTWML